MVEEKILTINLKKKMVKSTRWRRTPDFVKVLRQEMKKELKTDKIKIGKKLNDKIWARSIDKPQVKLRIRTVKLEDGSIRIELME